jgi:exodeoxyribonuclease-5
MPKLYLSTDVIKLEGDELLDTLNKAYSDYGFSDVLIITRSNKRAVQFNRAVRSTVRYMEDDICSGDLMMVVKNNYFWLDDKSEGNFIANGDAIEILKIIRRMEIYGFHFLEAVIRLVDYPDSPELQVKLIVETIYSESPGLSSEQQQAFFERVMEDTADEPSRGRRMAYLKQSEYFNALQTKFLYAVTCHKAQGGQWPVVFIDQGFVKKEQIDKNYLRWLYTAMTRAREKVYLINFSEDFFS